MALWLMLTMIAVLIAILLLRALRGVGADQRAAFDLRVYRDQLREVARDRERGLLSDDQAAAATAEIERRILAAGDDKEASQPTGAGPSGRIVTIAAAVGAPVAALALYLHLGSPNAPDMPFAERIIPAPPTQTAGDAPEMNSLIDRLASRLAEAPEDGQGWLLLARSYLTVERYDAALEAFEKALRHGGRGPETLSGYVEARVMAAGGVVDGGTLALADEVLASDPANPAALYYAGLGRAQQNDMRGAVQAWVDLAAVTPPDAPWLADVRRRIEAGSAELGVKPETFVPSETVRAAIAAVPAMDAPASTAPGPSRDDMEAAAQMPPEERAAMIRGMVEGLAARLEQEPGNLDGWVRLERAYRVLGESAKADDAARRVAALRQQAPAAASTPPAVPPPLRGPSQDDMDAAAQMSPEDRQEMIRGMVEGLAQRLRENPTDLQGWAMLERSYRVLGETAKADEVAKRIEAMRGAGR